MKINLIGSGWLARPLAAHLKTIGHDLLLTTTRQDKLSQLASQDLPTTLYKLGNPVPQQLLDCEVLVIAITNKDPQSYHQLFKQLKAQTSRQVIYISSTSVYANHPNRHTETSQNMNQPSPILQIERLLHSEVPQATTIRLAGLVGPQRHPGRFFKHSKTIKNPQAPVNLIHLADCIGVITAVITQGVRGEIFNACADTHPTKAAFYPLMAQQLGLPVPRFEHSDQGSYKLIDNHKIKSVLGYELLYPDVLNMPF